LDDAISVSMLLVCGIYLYLATPGTARAALRIVEGVALLIAAVIVFLGYRFALLITLYST
jgi:hypothetical protein